ncbi:nickel-responsive transcriptional regulator NikR [Hydrocarboniphaga sp.]|uniref:nickel-responsive transcriptional regulator NikR n=1 Tax=Hydrocarboniphaga sp. TaxID=2033016 RepID=UPI003D0BC1C2
MRRYTISIEDELADRFEAWSEQHGYENRSEAIRDLLRDRLGAETLQAGKNSHCIAAVTYVYDHHERDLSRRLADKQHEHHDLTVSTLHVHLDHSQCMEVSVLRGPSQQVIKEAQLLIAERGVHHGHVHTVPVPGPSLVKLRPHKH